MDDLARDQEAQAIAEEARLKVEAKTFCLVIEWTSLLLELEAAKDEVSSIHSQVGKDKEAMEEDYRKALELIFVNGYGCCVFKHNICGYQPEVPNGMPDSSDPFPPELFANRVPLAPKAIEVMTAEVDQSEAIKESEKSASTGNQS